MKTIIIGILIAIWVLMMFINVTYIIIKTCYSNKTDFMLDDSYIGTAKTCLFVIISFVVFICTTYCGIMLIHKIVL